jgi:hypothetical protein
VWRTGLVLALFSLLAASCGGDDASPPPRPVQLELLAPGDPATVDSARVQVRGRVTPAAAEVQVMGRPVDVTGGIFATQVDLEEGANVIDVAASSAGRRPATTAVRVVREVPVEIPALEGEDADDAIRELEGLGLKVARKKGGGLLDDLLPGGPGVCSLDPAPGTEVRRGTTVTVETAKTC